MRGSGRLLTVCQVISVEYVRFQTGRQGILTQYVEKQPTFRGYGGVCAAVETYACLCPESTQWISAFYIGTGAKHPARCKEGIPGEIAPINP